MEQRTRTAEDKLRTYNQMHLIERLQRLPEDERYKLAEQVDHIALDQLFKLLEEQKLAEVSAEASIKPIAYESWEKFEKQEQQAFTDRGWELLRRGGVGAIVVAGGNGSRLGYDGPKGTLDIGLPSGKSLFQLQAERLLHLSRDAGKIIPWYVMTSEDNHEATTAFLQASDYFGYPAEDCFIFQQNSMPAVGHDGQLLLSMDGGIKLAPSGHGDCFASLKRTGALGDMKRRGLDWLFYCNVDNALVKMADPAFIGVAAYYNRDIAAKVVEKTDGQEKIGIMCERNGRPAVLEYNEIPDEISNARSKEGHLLYHLGHISILLFKLDFIDKHADADIPYHMASKKMDHLDAKDQLIEPDKPNAYKLERFIFDFFPFTELITVLKVERHEEFAPVKNKAGVDSPGSARRLVLSLHRKWLIEAGVPPEKLKGRDIELSPLQSYGGEDLSSEGWESGMNR
ncbi:UTP--glucose-1-phosphate uridylyltransferase [Paenibacillus luteus]|uniref:UTP--glucose-1-phosphate uridylyltransferase n=1 Tax=Paenibacillus luteus TaxID=2545753 RepID=UPI001143BD83|nr:UDPGP type 1 family protein [Paenibacillus luteus]